MYPWHQERTQDLQPHHVAWLDAHPNRTVEWLRTMTRAGFDVHHIDGDHGNNDPGNLVLIEHGDHMMLHGMGGSEARKLGRLSQKNGKGKSGPVVVNRRRVGSVDEGGIVTLKDGRRYRLETKESAKAMAVKFLEYPSKWTHRLVFDG